MHVIACGNYVISNVDFPKKINEPIFKFWAIKLHNYRKSCLIHRLKRCELFMRGNFPFLKMMHSNIVECSSKDRWKQFDSILCLLWGRFVYFPSWNIATTRRKDCINSSKLGFWSILETTQITKSNGILYELWIWCVEMSSHLEEQIFWK